MPGNLDHEALIRTLGPAVREPLRKDLQEDLRQQTRDIQQIVTEHEAHDDEQFGEIRRKFTQIFDRQSRIELKLSRWGGMAAMLLLIIPIVWDLFKRFALGIK